MRAPTLAFECVVTMIQKMDDEREMLWFDLASQFERALGHGINSLVGKHLSAAHEHYCFWSAVSILRYARGYLHLKKGGFEAAPLLIRPALEAMIRGEAVRTKPSTLCRIAYSEYLEEKKLAASQPQERKAEAIKRLDEQWAEFKARYAERYPGVKIVEKSISIAAISDVANLRLHYEVLYRLHCKHSHGTLRAVTGGFDTAMGENTRTMVGCLAHALTTVKTLSAEIPNFGDLMGKITELNAADEKAAGA